MAASDAAPQQATMREFEFAVQGGTSITGMTRATSPANGKRIVVFTPFVDKTDGNLYNALLNSL